LKKNRGKKIRTHGAKNRTGPRRKRRLGVESKEKRKKTEGGNGNSGRQGKKKREVRQWGENLIRHGR